MIYLFVRRKLQNLCIGKKVKIKNYSSKMAVLKNNLLTKASWVEQSQTTQQVYCTSNVRICGRFKTLWCDHLSESFSPVFSPCTIFVAMLTGPNFRALTIVIRVKHWLQTVSFYLGLGLLLYSFKSNQCSPANAQWRNGIECFYSRGQHLCKFIGTKESVCIRKEFNSHRTGLGH